MKKIAISAMLIFFASCASAPSFEKINDRSTRLILEAEKLISQNKEDEAVKILSLVAEIHPDDKNLAAVVSQLKPENQELVKDRNFVGKASGFNVRAKHKIKSSILVKILLYIPNRILDILDLFSLRFSYGPQIGASVWATRGWHQGLYTGNITGIALLDQKKNIGVYREASFEFAVLPLGLGYYNVSAEKNGSSGTHLGEGSNFYHNPKDPIYQEYRDYWSTGVKVGVGYSGAEIEFHWLELFDLFAGMLFFDPLNDDLGSAKKYKFSKYQTQLMKDLRNNVKRIGADNMNTYKNKYPSLGMLKYQGEDR